MKKIILLFIPLLVILTGCVQTEFELKIDKDKSVNVKNNTFIEEKIFTKNIKDKDENEAIKPLVKKYKKNGFSFKNNNSKNNFKGYTVSKNYKNLNELSQNNDYKMFTTNVETYKKFLYTEYDVEIIVPWDKIGGELTTYINYTQDGNQSNFTVKLPYKPTNHNADKVLDNNTLKWVDLHQKDEGNHIKFSYKHYHSWVLWGGIGVGLLVISVITMIIIFERKRRRF